MSLQPSHLSCRGKSLQDILFYMERFPEKPYFLMRDLAQRLGRSVKYTHSICREATDYFTVSISSTGRVSEYKVWRR